MGLLALCDHSTGFTISKSLGPSQIHLQPPKKKKKSVSEVSRYKKAVLISRFNTIILILTLPSYLKPLMGKKNCSYRAEWQGLEEDPGWWLWCMVSPLSQRSRQQGQQSPHLPSRFPLSSVNQNPFWRVGRDVYLQLKGNTSIFTNLLR